VKPQRVGELAVSAVLPGHAGVVGDQAGEVHGVVDAGVEEVEGELVVLLHALLDLLEVFDLDAVDGVFGAVAEEDLAVGVGAEGTELGEDVLGGEFGGGGHGGSRRGEGIRVVADAPSPARSRREGILA
jgi:hypothetical protein